MQVRDGVTDVCTELVKFGEDTERERDHRPAGNSSAEIVKEKSLCWYHGQRSKERNGCPIEIGGDLRPLPEFIQQIGV